LRHIDRRSRFSFWGSIDAYRKPRIGSAFGFAGAFAIATGAAIAWAGAAALAWLGLASPIRKNAMLAYSISAWPDSASEVADISSAAPAFCWITLSTEGEYAMAGDSEVSGDLLRVRGVRA